MISCGARFATFDSILSLVVGMTTFGTRVAKPHVSSHAALMGRAFGIPETFLVDNMNFFGMLGGMRVCMWVCGGWWLVVMVVGWWWFGAYCGSRAARLGGTMVHAKALPQGPLVIRLR